MDRNRLQERVRAGENKASRVKHLLALRRKALDSAEKILREIESELLTGVSSIPLIASAQRRNGPPADAPDVTESEQDGSPRRPSRPARPNPIGSAIGTYEQELDWCVQDALGWGGMIDRLTASSDDDEIEDEIKNLWGHADPDQCKGYRVRAFPAPAFYLGESTGGVPTLAGKALYARVRTALGLLQEIAETAKPAPKPARKRKESTRAGS